MSLGPKASSFVLKVLGDGRNGLLDPGAPASTTRDTAREAARGMELDAA